MKINGMAGISGAFLICMLVIGTASAYDADIACVSLREVIAESHDVSTIELVALGPNSFSQMIIRPKYVINPEVTLCVYLKSILEGGSRRTLSQVVLTMSQDGTFGEKRVSYQLSPSTSVFLRLEEPFDPANTSTGNDPAGSYSSFTDRFMFKKGVTKSSVLSDLVRTQKTRPSLSPLLSEAPLRQGTLKEVKDIWISQLTAQGQGDLASAKSELIRKYMEG